VVAKSNLAEPLEREHPEESLKYLRSITDMLATSRCKGYSKGVAVNGRRKRFKQILLKLMCGLNTPLSDQS
jgi:hypothetical protein